MSKDGRSPQGTRLRSKARRYLPPVAQALGAGRQPLKRKRDPIVKRLDALCREVVFARDGHACVMTGQTVNLQWAHIRSRRYQSTRWAPENSLCLSAGKHLWAHHNPLAFSAWFQEQYPDRAQYLALAGATMHKIDRKLIELDLRQQLAKLGGAR